MFSKTDARSRHDNRSGRDKEMRLKKKPSKVAELMDGVSDLEWFASNPSVLDLFREMYVAIDNGALVGWGDSVKEASNIAKAYDIHSDPLIAYVESGELKAF
jgi:hypothetical protein